MLGVTNSSKIMVDIGLVRKGMKQHLNAGIDTSRCVCSVLRVDTIVGSMEQESAAGNNELLVSATNFSYAA